MWDRPNFETFAELPGRVVWMSKSPEGGLWAYYVNPKRWWQFWKPEIVRKHLCPHGDDWDDCPDCRH